MKDNHRSAVIHLSLVVWTLTIVAVTTLPWSEFQGHSHWDKVIWNPLSEFEAVDAILNVALFVPLGALWAWRSPASSVRRGVLGACLLGAGLSMGVELVQVYSHGRIPSMTDVLTNVTGAGLGAMMLRPSPRRRGALAPDIPGSLAD